MATRSTGQSLQSDLSESLRRKAEALRSQNEAEKKEVYETEREFEKVVEQERMRIEEEVMRQMQDRKWSVDDEAQAKREAEAQKAIKEAEAEEARERKMAESWSSKSEEGVKVIINKSRKLNEDYLSFQGKNLNPELYKPIAWSGTFEREWMGKAPPELKDALGVLFESTTEDNFDFETAMNRAYIAGAGGKGDDFMIEPKIVMRNPQNIPNDEEHKAGLKNMQKFEKLVRSMLKATKEKDMAFDKDGNYRD